MQEYVFSVPGAVVPYTRMTQRSKFSSPKAMRYLAWKDGFGYALSQIMALQGWDMLLPDVALWVRVDYVLPASKKRAFDLDNVIKSVLDAAQGVVFENDMAVDHIEAHRAWTNIAEARLLLVVAWEAMS